MFPLCLKHPAAIFILIVSLFHHTFSEANSTLTIQPPSVEYDPSDPLWLENPAGYGGSNFYDFPKKPPYGYGGVAALHHSRWLVPVLGYSMIAQGDRLRFQVIPVITWLAVVLETTANMWFHDQLVRDWMDRQGTKVIGDPVFMAEVADNDTSATGPASGSVSGKSGQQSSMEVTTSPINSTTNRSPEDNQGHEGDDGEDKIIHLCDSKSCPACNHGPCHCPDCLLLPGRDIEEQRVRLAAIAVAGDSETPEDLPETTSAIRSATPLSPAENMVLLLGQREYTGQLQVRDKLFLGATALQRRISGKPELEFTTRTCDRPDEPESADVRDWFASLNKIKGVIPMDNGNFLSWTATGNIKIWSVQGGPLLSDEIPVQPCETIHKVFVIGNDHIVVWLEEEGHPGKWLREWNKVVGSWQWNMMATDIDQVEQLRNRQLVTFSRKNELLSVWATGEQWLVFTRIQKMGDYSYKFIGVLETEFITYEPVFSSPIKQQYFCWRKENGRWTPELLYSTFDCSFIDVHKGTAFLIEAGKPSAKVWSEGFCQWVSLPHEAFSFFRFLPGKRLYMTEFLNLEKDSLSVMSETEGKWKLSVLYRPRNRERLCYFDTLDDKRLVLVIRSFRPFIQHGIWIVFEEQGVWHKVILGYSDSVLLGMAVQHGTRLITWHLDGTIRTWNLLP